MILDKTKRSLERTGTKPLPQRDATIQSTLECVMRDLRLAKKPPVEWRPLLGVGVPPVMDTSGKQHVDRSI